VDLVALLQAKEGAECTRVHQIAQTTPIQVEDSELAIDEEQGE